MSSGIAVALWRQLRRAAIRLMRDPVSKMKVHERSLEMPLSHVLPEYLRDCPLYDTLPQRLAAFVRLHSGRLCAIDVGANIGDTIAAMKLGKDDTCLAIEPSERYCSYLRRNCAGTSGVVVVRACCSDHEASGSLNLVERDGTGQGCLDERVSGSDRSETLDGLVARFPQFSNANFIKTDTDGNDLAVLRGGLSLIKEQMPAVLFECDVGGRDTDMRQLQSMLSTLRDVGYTSCLVYDNTGVLLGRYETGRIDDWRSLCLYQMVRRYYYFDVVAMREPSGSEFHRSERLFMAGMVKSGVSEIAAHDAASD